LSKHENDALKTLIKMNVDNHYEKLSLPKAHYLSTKTQKITHIQLLCIVVTYEIRVFFEGAKKEAFSSILKKNIIMIQRLENWPLYQVFSSIF